MSLYVRQGDGNSGQYGMSGSNIFGVWDVFYGLHKARYIGDKERGV